MDQQHFDHLARALAQRRSRRTLGLLGAGILGAGSLSGLPVSLVQAKRKKKRKKKPAVLRECPGGTKRCGEQCVPSTGCCSDSDCNRCKQEVCLSNLCTCKSGQIRGSATVCGVPVTGCLPVGGFTTSPTLCCSGNGLASGDEELPIVCVPGVSTCNDDSGCFSGPCKGFMCPELYAGTVGPGC